MEGKNYEEIKEVIEKRNSVGCYIEDDDVRSINIIPLCISEEFLLAANDEDFAINGFLIIPVRNIISVDSRSKGKYNEILHNEGVVDNIDVLHLRLDSYKDMFESFLKYDMIISMDTLRGFYLGKIEEVGEDSISFLHFDAMGGNYSDEIYYEDIYIIYVKDRYADVFSKYIDSK